MNAIRNLLVAIPVTLALTGGAVADTGAPTNAPADPASGSHRWHRGAHHGMKRLLGQLNLTANQEAQVTSIRAQAKPRFVALHADNRTTRQQLASTPPTDPAYAGLLATAKANAANAVQLRSDIWGQVYAVLTPSQQAQIPDLIAARQQERAARRPKWQATHAETGSSG